jgi:outer membrane protein OmpA-like peptidoglycan-associated protein
MNPRKALGLSALIVSTTLGSAMAQTAQSNQAGSTLPPQTAATSNMNPDDSASYATGKPLEMQSKEGFWGHMNPLARKKWVHRQVDPIKDRTNELDQLQAKNANDIKDVDSRATAGINRAMVAANTADAHAMDANNRATSASTMANNASTRTTALNGTVSNLDQYQQVSSTAVPFVSGHTALGTKAKANLDDLAAKLGSEKGYIVEVQGYSRGGVQTSQAMADSVVRYLVTEHQVPIYRIYRTGLGKQTDTASTDGEKPLTNGVRVTLLHNSLATMGSDNSTQSSAVAPTTNNTQSQPTEASN